MSEMRSVTPAVVGRGVELRYGDHVALAASDFTIPAGASTVMIGPNGSGKSTLLAAIAGLHPVHAGDLQVAGGPPGGTNVAFVMQATKVNELLPVTVREVVAMGRYAHLGLWRRFGPADRRAVEAAILRLGLSDVAGRHLAELSGGQRQRVFVAQGLAQEHSILLMDEPTTGLDLVSSAEIARVVEEETAEGKTVVLAGHDLAEAAEADHVILLANRVVAEGPPAEVLVPALLSEAYQTRIFDAGGILVDDSAHRAAGRRHVHRRRRGVGGGG